jgi:hypothetical protein
LLKTQHVADCAPGDEVRKALSFLGARGAQLDERKNTRFADARETSAIGGVVGAAVAAVGRIHRIDSIGVR